MRRFMCLLPCLLLMVGNSPMWADDEKVPLEKAPAAVVEALKKRFPQATIKGLAKETDNGKTIFEVNLRESERNIDVILTPEGVILTIEKEITAKELPKVVAEAVEAKYPKATYKKYEEVYKVKEGKETLEYYEVILDSAGKKDVEVEVSPDGKIKN